MDAFLDLPARSAKPRSSGLTHVLDRGLSVAQADGLLEVAGDFVDIVKLGWGTALVTGNLAPKIARYREHGIPVVLGGTLTEAALRQRRVDPLVDWMRELGLQHVEVSDGTIELSETEKVELIQRLTEEGFTVLSEVGSKDEAQVMAPYLWIEHIERELKAGAWKVIAEAREAGNVGLYRADGEVRQGLVAEVVHAIPMECLIFEAPRKEQQAWFLRRYGPDVNFGNIAPEDVLSLETMRLGLRSDTLEALSPGPAGE